MAHYGTPKNLGKHRLPGPVTVGEGRTQVRLALVPQGRDLVLLIGGGEVHVGAVAVALPARGGGSPGPSGPVGSVVIPPHKEEPLAARCAAIVAEAAGCACAAVAGIHQDDATAAEIAAICANTVAAAEELAARLRAPEEG